MTGIAASSAASRSACLREAPIDRAILLRMDWDAAVATVRRFLRAVPSLRGEVRVGSVPGDLVSLFVSPAAATPLLIFFHAHTAFRGTQIWRRPDERRAPRIELERGSRVPGSRPRYARTPPARAAR